MMNDIAGKLKEMFEHAPEESKDIAMQSFGIRYGKELIECDSALNDIVKAAGVPEEYQAEIENGIQLYNALNNYTFGVPFAAEQTALKEEKTGSEATNPRSADEIVDEWYSERARGGFNKIFYGAPGCGKSHHVGSILKDANVQEENIFRVTFHPEYMNCDFVGQILPVIAENTDTESGRRRESVTYQFNPGPFTQALARAFQTKNMVYLIVEEINRGNAAAIFGDLFQLLDRLDMDDDKFGRSEYPIRNVNIYDYLKKIIGADVISNVCREGIFIPSNMTILATMNSSDQNVFTLDTAFKRRWTFGQISNDITKDSEHAYKGYFIPGTDVTWETFLVKLNDEILNYKIQNQTNEDKRLGKYFVRKDCLTETAMPITAVEDIAQEFAYKVLEYIWNDVCKIGRDDWFDLSRYKTLEDLIDAFVHPVGDASPLDVFSSINFRAQQ